MEPLRLWDNLAEPASAIHLPSPGETQTLRDLLTGNLSMVLRRETSYGLSHHVGQSTSANRYRAGKVSALPCLMSTFFPEPISVNCLYPEAKSCQTEIFLFLNLSLHTT